MGAATDVGEAVDAVAGRDHLLHDGRSGLPGRPVAARQDPRLRAGHERRAQRSATGGAEHCGPVALVGVRVGEHPVDVRGVVVVFEDRRPAEYRAQTGATGRLFPKPDDGPWLDHDFRNWRKRNFRPATEVETTACTGPSAGRRSHRGDRSRRSPAYDLRHSFASLLIHEGRPLMEIADQLGHSVEALLRHYAHVIADGRPAADPGRARDRQGAGQGGPRMTQMRPQTPPSADRAPLGRPTKPLTTSYGVPMERKTGKTILFPGKKRKSPLSDSNRRPLPYHHAAGDSG